MHGLAAGLQPVAALDRDTTAEQYTSGVCAPAVNDEEALTTGMKPSVPRGAGAWSFDGEGAGAGS